MRKNVILFITTVLLLSCASAPDTDSPGPSDPRFRWVDSSVGLRLRETPGVTGKKLGLIPYASRVTILEEQAKTITISRRKGKWTRIDWEGKRGWAFGGFLSKKLPGTRICSTDECRKYTCVSIKDGECRKGVKHCRPGRCVMGNCTDGFGVMIFPLGSRYTGEFKNGMAHGKGDLFFCFGGRIKGDFRNDDMHGRIVMYEINGEKSYEGEAENGKYHGWGIRYYQGEVKYYEGNFRNGLPHGEGIKYHSNGKIMFKVRYKGGRQDGAGIEYWGDGTVMYKGMFKKGRYNGEGILYRKNGTVYHKGLFRDGQPVTR